MHISIENVCILNGNMMTIMLILLIRRAHESKQRYQYIV